MKNKDPEQSNAACAKQIAKQYGYDYGNILRIVQIMATDTDGIYFDSKRRLSPADTQKRDKALFIDFLRWNGDKKEFISYAAEKYGLKKYSVYVIIKYCLYADPKRFDMV